MEGRNYKLAVYCPWKYTLEAYSTKVVGMKGDSRDRVWTDAGEDRGAISELSRDVEGCGQGVEIYGDNVAETWPELKKVIVDPDLWKVSAEENAWQYVES